MIHMIGQAHLDPVWLWTKREGFGEVTATFRSALDRIRETGDFIFTCSSAAYYEWIEQNEPEMFEEIRKAVHDGKWIIAGGWWIQPDCNMPSGELFARHGLYSQSFYAEKFGVMSKTGYCVDSFGHNAMLPQLLLKSRMYNYVFMRPDERENADIPFVFWWESADGSKVLAHKIAKQHYGNGDIEKDFEAVKALSGELGHDMMCFYGVGNHGGGPTRKNIAAVRAIIDRGEQICFSSPNQYFDTLRASNPELPVWNDDMQHTAAGCPAIAGNIKANHRKSENMLLTAEKFAAASGVLFGTPFRRDEFDRAFKNIMFNQFHDILCGCSIKDGLDDALNMFGESLSIASRSLDCSLLKIAKNIDTKIDGVTHSGKADWQLWEEDDHGVPVVIFNPLSYEVDSQITLSREMTAVCDENGQALPFQYVKDRCINGGDRRGTLFNAKIPAMGYTTYWLYKSKTLEPAFVPGELKVIEEDGRWNAHDPRRFAYTLENEVLSVTFDRYSGAITRMYDKEAGHEIISEPSGVPVVLDDSKYDTWAHNYEVFDSEIGKMRAEKVTITERGPLRASVRVKYIYNNSYVIADYFLSTGQKSLEVGFKCMWLEKHTMLKYRLYSSSQNGSVYYEIPYGVICRPPNGQEEPGLSWIDYTGDIEGGVYGIALANDGKYSYSVTGNALNLTLLRNSIIADHSGMRDFDEEYDYVDEGLQYIRCVIAPHAGDFRESGITRIANELNNRPIAVIDTYHSGSLPRAMTFGHTDRANVTITAFKPAHRNPGAYVVRCHESDCIETDAIITLPLLNVSISAHFSTCEAKTFLISDGKVSETDFLEE